MQAQTALTEYLNYCARHRRAKNTIVNHRYIALRFFRAANLDNIEDTTDASIDAFVDVNQHLASSTLYKHLSLLRTMYKWLQRKSYIAENPFEWYEMPKYSHALRESMSVSDLQRLLEYIPQDPLGRACYEYSGYRDNLIWHFCALAGLRIHETLTLKMNDLQNGRVYVRHGKGDKPGTVPIVPRLQAAVDRYMPYLHYQLHHAPTIEDWIFPGAGNKHISTPYIWVRFKDAMVVLGLEEHHYSFHSLRHTYATLLLRQGCNLPTIQELLRHSSMASTQIYLHVEDVEVTAAAMQHPLAAAPISANSAPGSPNSSQPDETAQPQSAD